MPALELLDATPLDHVTELMVRQALEERIEAIVHLGGVALPADAFWQDDTLANYRAAHAQWPHDAPMHCALPTLRELCMYVAAPAGATLAPAMTVLQMLWDKVVAWMREEGRDLSNANEDPVERRRRLTRERVKRHRDLVREVDGEQPGALEVRECHAAYMAACLARREALALVHAAHDPQVESAHRAWQAARSSGTASA